jgi:two-component system, cell cycle sensor histidine kinase and response regulator CckA
MTPPIDSGTLLIVEDNPGDAELIEEYLSDPAADQYSILHGDRLSAAIGHLREEAVDVVLLDLRLPDATGLDTLRAVRAVDDEVPVVVLSGIADESLALACIDAGAQDYLIKEELRPRVLRRALRYAITRRREERERQRQLQRVVGANPDAVVVADAGGRVRFVNEAAVTLFHRRREDFVGEPLGFDLREGEFSEIEIPGGKEKRTAQMHVVAIDWEGIPAHLASIRDVTEPKRLAEKIRLSQKIEAVGTLAGGIAHEFNNVLAVIGGSLTLARADLPADHPAQERLDQIERAAGRGADVVRQVLTFSRYNDAPRRRVVQLAAVVGEAARFLRATLPAQVAIDTTCPADLPPIEADATQLHQILMNLATNASYAMPDGGRLELSLAAVSVDAEKPALAVDLKPGRYVRLSVQDSGRGIDREALERIFEPFFTTKGAEGTGLGLAVVHGIVKSHGGSISVYSEPRRGTVFHLYFPASARSVSAEAPTPKATVGGQGERIVFVDDESTIVSLFSLILERLGYRVAGFDVPEEALAAVRADPGAVDLVITDLSMPKMDGPALVRELLAVRPDLPIVMSTGYVGEHDLEMAKRLGVAELVRKPFSRETLAEVVNRVLAGNRSA